MFDLSERVALITGGGYGLGKAFASIFAAHGAFALCADVDRTRADAAVTEICAAGGKAQALDLDVADEASVERAFAAIAARGRLDILVNNAGIATPPARIHELKVADWDRLMAINLRGAFLCTRAALPLMLAASRGSIINIASILGLVGFYPGVPSTAGNYGTSKAALIGLTRQTAIEYARDGIRANAIAPGWHGGTDLGRERRAVASADEIAFFEGVLRDTIPMGHRGRPDDLQGLALYLASDASHYVTGQVFAHDGGWTAA